MRDRYRDSVETNEGAGSTPFSEIKGKSIVTIAEGEKLGQVVDILIDRDNLAVVAVVSSQGGLFNTERKTLRAADVTAWGRDAVLVKDRDVFQSDGDLSQRETWVSAGDRLQGLSIVNTSGDRVGKVNDILLSNDGRIVGYRVSEGAFGTHHRDIDAAATISIGLDAVILDADHVERR